MTTSEPPIQSWSLRSLPPLTWLMVLLGFFFVTTSISGRSISLPGMLAGLVPFLFAATVTYMKPADPRFLYGAVLIGVGRGLSVLAILIASQGVVRGDFADVLFDIVALVDTPMELIGVLLLGVAAGGIRTRVGWLILLVGILIGVAKAIAFTTFLPTLWETMLVFPAGLNLMLGLLFPVAWAFVAAAAFEARLRQLLLGSLVLLVVEAVLIVFTAVVSNPNANTQAITLLIDVLQIIGWLLLAVSPLRLEMGTQRPLREEVEAAPR